jgi:S-DNA-T family DNA segregation ATPase FtsK/SpoIIIE
MAPASRAVVARSRRARGADPARRKRTPAPGREHHRLELIGLALVAVGAFLAIVLWFSWDGGAVGDNVSGAARFVVGGMVALLPVLLLALGGLFITRSRLLDMRPFRTGLIVLAVSILLAFAGGQLGIGPDASAPTSFDVDRLEQYGGVLGGAVYILLEKGIGGMGVGILTLFGMLSGALLVTGASAGAVVRRSGHVGRHVACQTARAAAQTAVAVRDASVARATRPPTDGEREFPDALLPARPPDSEPTIEPLLPMEYYGREVAEVEEPAQISLDDLLEPQTMGISTSDGSLPADPELFDRPRTPQDYRLPDRSLLRHSRAQAGPSAKATERVAATLVETLRNFGIEATLSGLVAGPRVTRYELQLAPGTKVSRVSALKDDLAYTLATTEIRILAPIPGKQAVGVEVPNASANLVTLGDIFADLPAASSPVSVWLGKDISGAPVSADLARMPHVLIAGTTGSGKSGCINTMLCSILLRSTPDDVRMILIDPKRVELGLYESIPHLLTPVVSSPKRAAAVLANVVEEMERRYERMSMARSRNLPELNRVLEKRGEPRMPYLLVVIDELADLMMVSPQAVEDSIIRLAQKSRAVGIHLVLATQRPSVDVITGMIKANVPSRIAFAVSSQTDSRVILDTSGAEALLGQGDMLFKPVGTSRLQRVQGAYVSDDEVALIVEQCRSQREQELDESLLEERESSRGDGEKGDEDFDPDEDPLLERAIEIVVQTQTASVSLIQRRLRVGYTRAGRLIDMLERRGVISGYEGSKPRRVLVPESDLDRLMLANSSEKSR